LALASLIFVGCGSAPPAEDVVKPADAGPLRFTVRAYVAMGDYVLGPEDLLEVRVFDVEKIREEKAVDVEVAADGTITLPLLGRVPAAGCTLGQLRDAIDSGYAQYVVDPHTALSVKEFRSHKIIVQGSVAKPGFIVLRQNEVSLVEALSLAGGLSPDAGTTALVTDPAPVVTGTVLLAGVNAPRQIDLIPLTDRGEVADDIRLKPGSVVVIPKAKEFFVSGYVGHAGAIPYQRPTTVTRAIALAGGLDARKASPSAVEVDRPTEKGVERIHVDLDDIAHGEAEDIAIYPGDSIHAGRTLGWAIYSEVVDTALGGFAMAIAVILGTR